MCIWYIVEKPLTPQKIVFGDSSKPAANAISSPARRTRQVRAVSFGKWFLCLLVYLPPRVRMPVTKNDWKTSGFWDAQSTKLFHLGEQTWTPTGGFLASLTPSALEVPLGKTSTIPARATVMEAYQQNLKKEWWWCFSHSKNSQVFLHQFW